MKLLSITPYQKILAVFFALVVLIQNPPWPIWAIQMELLTSVTAIAIIVMTLQRSPIRSRHLPGLTAISVSFFYFFIGHGLAGSVRLSSALFCLIALMALLADDKTGAFAFELLSKALAVIILLSLTFWVAWRIGLTLDYETRNYGPWKGDDPTIIDNYYFFIVESQTFLHRFYSVFDEPGVLGTLAAIVLCGLRFDFSLKRTWILLAGGIATLSLAFLVLSMLGYVFFNRRIKTALFMTASIILTATIATIWISNISPSDESATLVLFYRVLNYSEYGVSSRTGDELNSFFATYIQSPHFIFGMGTDFFKVRAGLLEGQGGKLFLIEYGMFGLALVVLIYFSILLSKPSALRMHGIMLIFVLMVSFVQRPFLMTPWQIALFMAVMSHWRCRSAALLGNRSIRCKAALPLASGVGNSGRSNWGKA